MSFWRQNAKSYETEAPIGLSDTERSKVFIVIATRLICLSGPALSCMNTPASYKHLPGKFISLPAQASHPITIFSLSKLPQILSPRHKIINSFLAVAILGGYHTVIFIHDTKPSPANLGQLLKQLKA